MGSNKPNFKDIIVLPFIDITLDLFVYDQTVTTFVCMSDCCVVKVGIVFSMVDKFQCKLGILSRFNLNLVLLPKLWCFVLVVSSFQLLNAFSKTGYPAFYR